MSTDAITLFTTIDGQNVKTFCITPPQADDLTCVFRRLGAECSLWPIIKEEDVPASMPNTLSALEDHLKTRRKNQMAKRIKELEAELDLLRKEVTL